MIFFGHQVVDAGELQHGIALERLFEEALGHGGSAQEQGADDGRLQLQGPNRRVLLAHTLQRQPPELHLPQILRGDEAGAQGVVQVVGVVGQAVGRGHHLRLEQRLALSLIHL